MGEPVTGAAAGPDWQRGWDAMVAAVGQEFSDGQVDYGADAVTAADIRRFCEPLEFDCPLHHDADAARAAGFGDVILPYTAVMSWSIPPMWSPGDPPLFDDHSRNAQPARSPINSPRIPIAPPTSGFFATDMEFDYLRPVQVGERVGRRGRKLRSCVPKETSVGRGAFLTWESEVVTETGEVVARMRTGSFSYVPRPAAGWDAESADGEPT